MKVGQQKWNTKSRLHSHKFSGPA